MAKRRKLNKRVAVLLIAIGALVIFVVLAWALGGLGGGGLIDRLFPKDPVALVAKAKAALKSKTRNYKVASRAFEDAIRAAVRSESPHIGEYYYEYAQMNHEWALDGNAVLTKTQRGERVHACVSALRKALNRDPKYVDAQRYLANIFWSLARADRGDQYWRDYIKEADKLIKLAPEDHQAWFRRGLAKAAQSRQMGGEMVDAAIADMEKAVALDSQNVGYWMGLIQFLGGFESRKAQVPGKFEDAVKTVKKNAPLLVQYASYLRGQKRNADAKVRLEAAVKADPLIGNLALAEHYVALNSPDEALAALARAKAVDPLDPQAYLNEARIYATQDKPLKAAEVLRKGLETFEKTTETQPTALKRRLLALRRIELHNLLANVLLDMIEQGPQRTAPAPGPTTAEADWKDEKARLLAEARQCLDKMIALNVTGAVRAKVAGRIALAEGDINEAVKQLEISYKATSPRIDIRTANLLINIYLRQNLPGKADAILDRLLSIPGQQRNVSILLAKARLLMRYKDYDKADGVIGLVLKEDADNAEAQNMRMEILAIRGDVPALRTGFRPSRSTLRQLLERAGTLWLDGRQNEAVRYVEQLHASAPDDRMVITQLSRMYHRMNRLDDEEKLLDEALKRYPDDRAFKARRQLIHETDWKKQRDVLMKVADESPPLERALEKASVALQFTEQMGAEAEKEHLAYLQEAARIDPNSNEVVDRMFRFALSKKDWKLAEDCVDRAVKANLDGIDGGIYKLRLAMVREEYDRAIEAAQAVLKVRPNRKDARSLLAQAYLSKKDYEQAYEQFKIVYSNDPAYAPAVVGLSAVTFAQGKMSEHEAYVEAAYRLVPQDAYIRERWLELQEQDKSPEQLIARRELTLKRQPNDLRNILRLGFLYERVNRIDDAEKMYVTFDQKSADKLNSARVLCGFYLRQGRMADVERTIEPLLTTWKDRVGVLILYGQVLTTDQPERAEDFLKKALQADPEDARGYLALARFWASRQKWRESVDAMNKYVRRRPEDLGGVKELIQYSIEAGEYRPAEKQLNDILRGDPTDATALTLKGALALRQGQTTEAMKRFTQAIQDNPQYYQPLLYRARLYLAQGEPTKAKTDLQAAKRLSRRLDVAMRLGDVYEDLRDYDNAEMVYREVHAERKSYQPAIEHLISIYSRRQKWGDLEAILAEAQKLFPKHAGYLMAEAGMWHTRENIPKKLAALKKAVELAPDNALLPLRAYLLALQKANQHEQVLVVSQPYLDKPGFVQLVSGIRACSLAKLQRYAEAEKLFLQSLETIQADYALSMVHQLQAAYGLDGALEKFNKWIKERAKNWRLYLVLGVLHAEIGGKEHLEQAAQDLKAARDLAGKNELAKALSNRHLGATYYQMGQFTEAEKAYLACLQIRPNDFQVLNNIAYLYTNDLNEPRKALPYATRAAEQQPSNAKILDTYGWTLARIGRFSNAEQALVRAVQLEKPLAASRYHLGWVYEQLGRLEDAMKQYKQCFEMVRSTETDPIYRPAKESLDRVTYKLKQLTGSTK